MNANNRKWPRIKAYVFYAVGIKKNRICGYLRLFAFFALPFSFDFFKNSKHCHA